MNINENALNLEVEYTTAKPVEGLSGLGEWIWDVKVPVGTCVEINQCVACTR